MCFIAYYENREGLSISQLAGVLSRLNIYQVNCGSRNSSIGRVGSLKFYAIQAIRNNAVLHSFYMAIETIRN